MTFWGAASAQQELTTAQINGAGLRYFMRRLVGEFEKVAVAQQIPLLEISPRMRWLSEWTARAAW